MQIAVTGVTGFIGAHFAERALTAGHGVTGLYRAERPDNRPLLRHLTSAGAALKRGDILDEASLAEALHGSDVVCHFAAAFSEPDADKEYFNRVNVTGTAALLTAAACRGVKRFVYCSTAGIYGRRVAGVIDERSPVQPWNEYEQSKFRAEQEVRERARALGMEYVILRPSVVYGPRDYRLAKLFRNVVKGRFPLFGRGEGRRHMVHVSDVAEAFLRACEQPAAANMEMIIAGPEVVTLREMLQLLARLTERRSCGPRFPLAPMLGLAAVVEDVCKVLKVRPPIYRRRMDFYLSDAAFNCAHARQVLGWEPKVDLHEGMDNTLKAYRPENRPRSFAEAGLFPYLLMMSEAVSQFPMLLT